MALRRAREGWREEARARPKLEVTGRLMNCRYKARCVEIDCKRQREEVNEAERWAAKLIIETGRWCGLRRDEQICKMCGEGEVEVFYCTVMVRQRRERRWLG